MCTEITRSNFLQNLPAIMKAITNSDFIAIDTEFSGYDKGNESPMDTMAERYSKMRQKNAYFTILQYGLTCFRFDQHKKRWLYKAYNFLIYNKCNEFEIEQPPFMCMPSNLSFLAANKFDFNKVIQEGLSYLTPNQENKLKEDMMRVHQLENEVVPPYQLNAPPQEIPLEQEAFIFEIQIKEFLLSENQVMELHPSSPNLEKIIHLSLQTYGRRVTVSSGRNQDGESVIIIKKIKIEELLQKQRHDHLKLEHAVGFRLVLDHISEKKKLVVMHNCLYDIIYTMKQFYSELPETWEVFKLKTHTKFPMIVDTKVIATGSKFRNFFRDSNLFTILEQVHGNKFDLPIIQPASDNFDGFTINSELQHQAAYNAFCTGVCFIGLTGKMTQSSSIYATISQYLNRIYVNLRGERSVNLSVPD